MNGREADKVAGQMSLMLRRNRFDDCRRLLRAAEEVHERGRGGDEIQYIAEVCDDLRLTNDLERAGYESIDDLRGVTEEDLRKLPGIGPAKVQQVKEFLRKALERDLAAREERLEESLTGGPA